jgi:hypothetical protein
MSKPRDLGKEQFWRAAIDEWQQSGESVTAFCQQRQLQLQSFFRWRKVLTVRDQPAVAAEATPTPSALFLPVQLRLQTAAEPPFEIVLACGRLLRVRPGFDPAQLRLLLGVLEGASC